jgi:hypothetical protein
METSPNMANAVKETSTSWPMSNEELRHWFAGEDIPIAELARMWIQMDQNETTKTEIEKLCENPEDTKELEARLRKRIEFGTAGLAIRLDLT